MIHIEHPWSVHDIVLGVHLEEKKKQFPEQDSNVNVDEHRVQLQKNEEAVPKSMEPKEVWLTPKKSSRKEYSGARYW